MTMDAMSYKSGGRSRAATGRAGSLQVAPRGDSPDVPRGLAMWLLAPVAAVVSVVGSPAPARAEPGRPISAGSARTVFSSKSAHQVRLDTIARAGNVFTADLEGGAHAELTLDPRLQ